LSLPLPFSPLSTYGEEVGEEVKNIEIKIKLGYYPVGFSLDRCNKFKYITVVLNFVLFQVYALIKREIKIYDTPK